MKAVVVGAGVAGLSAAVRLAEAGVRVSVFERRAIAGGRAYSYRAREAGHPVDNGQHLMMGCYRRTLGFLERIGARGAVEVKRPLAVPMALADRRTATFRCARLPSPFHLTVGVLGYRHLTLAGRLRLLAGGMRLVKRHLAGEGLEGKTVAEALAEVGQDARSRAAFWDPLAIAVLNELPERASARLFAEVLRRVFFSRAAASDLVFPRTGLSEVFAVPASRTLERLGSSVECGTAVRAVELRDGRAAGVELRDGRRVEADAVILAVPPPALGAVLPERLRHEKPFERAAQLRSSPIVSVHLWLGETVPTPRMLGLLEGPLQWLFTPPMQPARGRYVTLVASGAHELVELPPEEILEVARRTLARYLPAVRELPWADSLVAKERAATFAASPAEQPDRPGAVTPVKNLFLAGDWTDTGLPATLESAVESGERAAACVLDQRGARS